MQSHFKKLSTLPLCAESRELVDFCLWFRGLAGFVAVYEEKLLALQANRKKRGLKTAAYEATEQLYCQFFNIGRRFNDAETFFRALSRHNRHKL